MSIADGWSMCRFEMIAWLGEAHAARHNDGPKRKATSRKTGSSSEGRDAAVREAEERHSAKSVAALNRKRKRQDELDEQHRRRVGAAIRRIERSQPHRRAVATSPHHALFEMEPSYHRLKLRDARDMYFEWIPRGLAKGEKRNYAITKPRIAAREAQWRKREFQDKILYIERPDALEVVEGNLVSNMGRTAGERLGCAERLEHLEPLSRKNANVYTHVILALPAALSPQGRAKLLARLCSHLDRLELPHCAALHKPDPNNSQDNFHAHILLSMRPMSRHDNQWHFAASKRTWIGTPAGLKLQRRVTATEFNRALMAEGQSLRWTHRSRAGDGLEPGGFTKRGGTRRRAYDEEFNRATANVANADEFLALVDEADRAVGTLQQIAVSLDRSDDRLSEMERKTDRAVAAPIPAVEFPKAIEPTTDIDVVANSQRPGIEREMVRESSPELAQDEPAESPAKDRVAAACAEPDLALIEAERQRAKRARRVEAARVKLAELELAASPDERARIAATFETLSRAFDAGLLLSIRDNGEIDIVLSDATLRQSVETDAMTTAGFTLLRAFASKDDQSQIQASESVVTLVDPAEDFDWLATLHAYAQMGVVRS